ncbi:PQQ-binding-like beta-propeller repeat protein [Emcibacter sp. SYSU 3D8]|uniref:outer membrane protein assembly factor BamB family protein n=1 Tax=Emcibacter sp. SYSU 3D8 TaxID=3133969 RepID=UPI0031FEFA58
MSVIAAGRLMAMPLLCLMLLAGPGAQAAPEAPRAFSDAYQGVKYELDAETAKRGGDIYAATCGACHDKGLNRAPQKGMLSLMTPESIHRALTEGVMRAQATGLTGPDKVAVAEFIAGRKFGDTDTAGPLMCAAGTSVFDFGEPPPYAGWGLTPASSHAISTEDAGIDRVNLGKLTLKWSLAFPNAIRARSQPTLAGGAIFVGSHDGTVFALDRETGCTRWQFHASAEVRTGIVVSPWEAGDTTARPLVYFGDLIGNVYAVDAVTGMRIWKTRADPHASATITAAPVLHGEALYVAVSSLEEGRSSNPTYECCTFRGSLIAYDARTGKRQWQTFMTEQPVQQGVNAVGARRFGPSGVALWNSPSVDEKRGRLYIASGDNYSSPTTDLSDAIVAFDMKSGRIVWSFQALEGDAWNGACDNIDKTNCPEENGPDYDFGAGTVLATASDGRDYVLAGQKSGILYAINPETGKLVWETKVGRGGVVAGIHFGLAAWGDTVFVPVSDAPDGRTYGEAARPGVYALDIKTGNYLWKAPAVDICNGKPFCHPGYGGTITATPELLFAGSNDGHLRAFDTKSGKILWDYDTVRDFESVNGAPARGGSMGGGAGPIIWRGSLIMNSGYGFVGAMGGNVLMVFTVD